MKLYPYFFLIFMQLVACVPQSLETPAPTLTITNTPRATPISEPTPTLQSTSNPSPAAEILSCVKLVDAKLTNAGVLEIVYASGDPYPIKMSQFLLPLDAEHTGLALWSDATQEAVPYRLPPDALGPKISTDHRWIVFRRDSGESQSELWVIDVDGQNERKLATLMYEEIEARYPDLAGTFEAILGYGWVSGMNKIYYHVIPGGGVGGPANYDMFVLVDIHSAQAISLAERGEVSNVVFSPNGSQAAVLTASELRLVSTQDGNVQVMLPMSLRSFGPEGSSSPAYSPDGKYVIGFTDEGILRMNAEDGQWQVIPLEYTAVVQQGDSFYASSPKITWVDHSTYFLPITDLPPDTFAIEFFQLLENPDASFTVWQVDLADAETEPIRSFTGFTPSVVFSPDGKRLAFTKPEAAGQPGKLFLVELNTGDILETLEASSLFAFDPDFIAWHPDSNRYFYRRGEYPDADLHLGQTGEVPIQIGEVVEPIGLGYWVDAERFVIPMGFCEIRLISTSQPIAVTLIP